MTVPATKVSLVDPILASDINWYRTNVGVGTNAFDGSPVIGQRCYRNDRGIEYYWDGTRWLSLQIFQTHLATSDTQPYTQAAHGWQGTFSYYSYNGILVTQLDRFFYFTAAQSVTNYYSFTLTAYTTTGGTTVLTAPGNTSGQTTLGFKSTPVDTYTQVLGNTYSGVQLACAVNGAPNTFYMTATLSYRLIG